LLLLLRSLLLGETRTASARASTKCVLSKLSQQDFFEVLSMFPEEENSLRETATMRLEQDIEREAKALRRKGNGARPFGSTIAHTQPATTAVTPLERTGTFHALREDGDELTPPTRSGGAGGGAGSDVQMASMTPSVPGSTKAESRLRYLEGNSAQPFGTSLNADFSYARSPTIDPSLHARSDKLNKIQSASVRQSLFAPHSGPLVGTTGLLGGGLVEGALANMVKRARRSIALQSGTDLNTAPATNAQVSATPTIPENANSPSMEAAAAPLASPSASPSRPRSGVNLSVDVSAAPVTFSVTVAPPEETAAPAATGSQTSTMSLIDKRLRAASTGGSPAIASIAEDGAPTAIEDDLFTPLPPSAMMPTGGGSGSATPTQTSGSHRHKRTPTLDKQALALALSSGSVNLPRKGPGLGSPTLGGLSGSGALADLRLRRNDPLATLHARSRTALFGGSAMARVVEQAMARAKAHRLPQLPNGPAVPASISDGTTHSWDLQSPPLQPPGSAQLSAPAPRSPLSGALPSPSARESLLEDKVHRLELQLAVLANQVSSLLAMQAQTQTQTQTPTQTPLSIAR